MYVYQHHFVSASGSRLSLDRFRGQPLLLVNISTESRFTQQLVKLQALWDNYRDFGLVVIGLPCDDFSDNEPDAGEDLESIFRSRFGVRFPLTARQRLTGRSISPLFAELKEFYGRDIMPRRNFCKYLFDQRGSLAANWSHRTEPDDIRFTRSIEQSLKAWII
jgi:glutathione peroxidase